MFIKEQSKTAYTILNGEYEVIEAEIVETSELINKELKNSVTCQKRLE